MSEKEKINILMVDDQPGKLLTYEVMLAELDENLIKATSGREALEHLLKHDVAVVLMDVSMPELDGFELAEIIRQHPRFQRTAIIFISAVHLTDLDRLKGYQRGAVDYISVPVEPELLRAKVTVFAELHRKTHQLEALNRGLESRVNERTEELARKAEALLQLNAALARKNQELDAIVETVPAIIFSSKDDGVNDFMNDRFQEYTGAATKAAASYDWMDYIHPEDMEKTKAKWMHCLSSGEHYEAEYRLQGKNGEYRWFRSRATPIRDQEERIVRWYGACSDVHDSKLLEQSIRDETLKLEKLVESRTVELRRLSASLITAQDNERRRIARELHDGLSQELAAAKITVDAISQQSDPNAKEQAALQASEIIAESLRQVRNMSYLLHPPMLDEVGLISAIRWYLDGFTKRSGIETTLEISPDEMPRLPREFETAVFRIIQESLTNIFKHAEAHKSWVSLVMNGEHIMIRVADDGKGIKDLTHDMQPSNIGVGLGGMKQRIKELDGKLQLVNTAPGTLVEVLIPLNISVPKVSHVANGMHP